VVQAGEILAGSSRYSFEPRVSVDIAVTIEERPVGRQRAAWDGNPAQFVATLAAARLYDSAIPEERTVTRRARGASAATVLLLRADGRAESPGADPGPNELAQHRLLDLLADLYLFGGPPLGRIRAWQPEHGATHHAIRQALEFGLLAYQR
jgi:UDP-3-O-acyl-N-acetylglucosamine deacetylase